VDGILLEEIKGIMVDIKKLKKLNGAQYPGENKESLFAKFVEEKWKWLLLFDSLLMRVNSLFITRIDVMK
jgi:hypothetical protein